MIFKIFSDGSAHTQLKLGSWASILLHEDQEVVLKAIEKNTTHQRMELLAVIKSIDFIIANKFEFTKIEIYTDSQYVVKLRDRKDRLLANKFITKKGKELNNSDLLKRLIDHIENYNLEFYKVKAHQKGDNFITRYNNKVDNLVRKLMHENIELAKQTAELN